MVPEKTAKDVLRPPFSTEAGEDEDEQIDLALQQIDTALCGSPPRCQLCGLTFTRKDHILITGMVTTHCEGCPLPEKTLVSEVAQSAPEMITIKVWIMRAMGGDRKTLISLSFGHLSGDHG